MSRIYRELDDDVKQKISASMKAYHASQSEASKQKVRNAQANSMRQYWAKIPSKTASDGTNHTTMNDLIGAN